MVKCIADNGIFFSKKRFEDTAISIEAGSVEDCVFRMEVVCDSLLKSFVNILCAADEAYTTHAEAVCVHSTLGSFDEARVVA